MHDTAAPRTIAFVDHATELGGAELSLLALMRGLDRTRFRPVLLQPQRGALAAAAEEAGVELRYVPMPTRMLRLSRETARDRPLNAATRLLDMLVPAHRVRRIIRETGAAILHTNSIKAHFLGAIAATGTGAHLVIHERNILEPSAAERALRLIADRRAARLIAISDAVARPYRASLRQPEKVVVVYNGIDPRPFASGDGTRVRRDLGVDPDQPLVVQIGQIARWKGQDVFLRAVAQVAREFPRARFAIVGRVVFPQNEAAYEKHLHALAEHLRLRGRLVFAGHRTDIPDVLGAADLLVHAAVQPEPFGRVLIEAMAAGVPVIAAAAGGVPEIVAAGETGHLVPPGDPASLGQAMRELLASPERRAAQGEAGRRRVLATFTEARMVAGVVRCYRSLLADGRQASEGGGRQ